MLMAFCKQFICVEMDDTTRNKFRLIPGYILMKPLKQSTLIRSCLALFFLLQTGICTTVHAQQQTIPVDTAFQIQQFRPWNDPTGMFQTQSALTLGQFKVAAGIYFDYASDPLTLRNPQDRSSYGDGKLISHQMGANLVIGIGLLPMMDLIANLPMTLHQAGRFPQKDVFQGKANNDLSGTALSDIKVGLKFRIVDERSAPLSFGLQAYAGLPSGDEANFNGSSGVSFGANALLGKQLGIIRMAANLGFRYQPETKFLNLVIGSEFTYGVAMSLRVVPETVDVVAELAGSAGLSDGSLQSAPFDFYAGIRFFPSTSLNLGINLGVSIPVLPGYGSPLFRVLAGVIWSTKPRDFDGDGVPSGKDDCPQEAGPSENKGCPWGDTDGDGLKDNVDRCPKKAGDKKNKGCPWDDYDGDGLKDNVDKCPKKVGPSDNQGCPWPDADKDGVPDKDDKCPKEKGKLSNNGCPFRDRDKDGIIDKLDKCPNVPGSPRLKGCPVKLLVEVTKTAIKIKQKIFFDFGKSTIKSSSNEVLDQVYSVLKSNPQTNVRIEGHTDNIGTPKYNMELSQKRAEAVRNYLIDKGIPHYRLTAKGYGRTLPIADNSKEAGRARNRRVEFKIVK